MRNLSVNALAQIATKLGSEPVTIIEVDWVQDVEGSSYADRDIGNIQGRILEVSNLDNVINVSENNSSQEISIVLDDTNGTIKTILDTYDIHKRSARVYQWFEGMAIDDKFLVFAGKISSPIIWSERDRSVSFTVISQLEDKEIGFSAEEGDFEWIPKDLIGKTWPMIFGTVQDSPCLQFNKAVAGTTQCGIGIISGIDAHLNAPLGGNSSQVDLNASRQVFQVNHLNAAASGMRQCGEDDQANSLEEQSDNLWDQMVKDSDHKQLSEECQQLQRELTVQQSIDQAGGDALGCNPIRILGGEDFQQGIGLKLRIGSGIFSGYFEGVNFYITDRIHEENEEKALNISQEYERLEASYHNKCTPKVGPELLWLETELPCKTTWGRSVRSQMYLAEQETPENKTTEPEHILQHHWEEAGTKVSLYDDEEFTYVASTISGTVLSVKAYKKFKSDRKLVNLPEDLYRVETVNYGPITAVQIVVTNLLSSIPEQGWEDDLYVTFQSSVGPHTCDILEYIITNFTGLEFDSTSFTEIRTKLDPFPMNFPILSRKNTIDVLQDIAFQARCALWLSNGTFYIKYLPEDPISNDTITDSDVDAAEGLKIELTSTEDLVTKMVANWRVSWAEDEEQKIILRHNVKKYGTQTEDFDFFCFSQPDIVLKAATFWLIRKSNTWKKVSFKSYLNKLNLETFDTVTLSFSGNHVATGDIKAIVEEASYNSVDQTIDFVCLTPVKSGTMEEYIHFWPSALATTEKFPTDWEREQGYAGGGGIGVEATGALPVGFMDPDDWGDGVVWVGGSNVVFNGHADWGDRSPTDVDFIAQSVVISDTYAELDTTANPNPDLRTGYMKDQRISEIPSIVVPGFIDLRKTKVMDSETKKSAPLITFFKKVDSDKKLIVDCDISKWGNAEEEDGKVFDFKYDSEGEKMGAGTAFLKAEDSS